MLASISLNQREIAAMSVKEISISTNLCGSSELKVTFDVYGRTPEDKVIDRAKALLMMEGFERSEVISFLDEFKDILSKVGDKFTSSDARHYEYFSCGTLVDMWAVPSPIGR